MGPPPPFSPRLMLRVGFLFSLVPFSRASDPGGWITPLYGNDDWNISKSCLDASHTYLESINSSETWARQMLDSNGRLPMEGFLDDVLPIPLDICTLIDTNNTSCQNSVPESVRIITINIPIGYSANPGSYEGCLAVTDGNGISGKYSVVSLKTPSAVEKALEDIEMGRRGLPARQNINNNLYESFSKVRLIPGRQETVDKIINNNIRLQQRFLKHFKFTTNSTIQTFEKLYEAIENIHKNFLKDDPIPPSQEQIEGIILAIYTAVNNPWVGMCFPSTCSTMDIITNYKVMLEPYALAPDNEDLTHRFETQDTESYTDQTRNESGKPLPGINIFIYAIFGCISLLVVMGTMIEILPLLKSSPPPLDKPITDSLLISLIKSFSLYSNGSDLIKTSAQGSGHLDCLNGMRFLSMSWVVVGHCFLMPLFDGVFRNTYTFLTTASTGGYGISFEAIFNAAPSVDTFFFMGGTLTSYIIFRELEKAGDDIMKHTVTFVMYYVHRYLRLTITYALIMGVVIAVIPYVSYGPRWQTTSEESDQCKEFWWTHLLYINTLLPGRYEQDGCMGVTWYLVCDMIFHWFSPIVFYPMFFLWRKTSNNHVASVTYWTLVLAAFTAIVAYVNYDLRTALDFGIEGTGEAKHYVPDIYNAPWNRYQPYLVGVLLGYILHHTRGKTIKIDLIINILLWQASFLAAFAVVYGEHSARVSGYSSMFMTLMYHTFQRLAWSFSLAWVVFSCVKGYGGIINQFLSWSVFAPLARLTYCCYLIHMSVIVSTASSFFSTFPSDFNMFNAVVICIGCLTIALCASVILVLGFEFPFTRVEKLLVGKLLLTILGPTDQTKRRDNKQPNGILKAKAGEKE